MKTFLLKSQHVFQSNQKVIKNNCQTIDHGAALNGG